MKGIIYKVVNEENGIVYIGATTHSIHQRKLDHTERANRNEENKFYDAISTYGIDAFKWEQIDSASSMDELAQKEQQYVLEFNSKEGGYNSSIGGEFKKTVFKYNLENGELLDKFDGLDDAANSIGSTKQHISRACLSVNKIYNGYYWSYDCKERFIPPKDKRRKKVVQLSLDGDIIAEFNSVAEASRKTGVSKSCIARFCRGERKPPKDYRWEYK